MRPTASTLLLVTILGCATSTPPALRHLNLEGVGRLPAFSHATVAGDLVFVSGALGTRADTTELVPGGVPAETAQILRNLETILAAAGATRRDVAKCNVYLLDVSEFGAMNEVWLGFFPEPRPARTTVGVAELVLGARVEVECVARRP
jgi:reactive intermediate/imine deaminase